MPFFFKKSSYALLFIFLIGFSLQSYAQEESWETYIAKKDKGFMTVTVNMELNFARPNYKNLLIVGTHTSKCLKNDYPKEGGLENNFKLLCLYLYSTFSIHCYEYENNNIHLHPPFFSAHFDCTNHIDRSRRVV